MKMPKKDKKTRPLTYREFENVIYKKTGLPLNFIYISLFLILATTAGAWPSLFGDVLAHILWLIVLATVFLIGLFFVASLLEFDLPWWFPFL